MRPRSSVGEDVAFITVHWHNILLFTKYPKFTPEVHHLAS